MLEFLVSQSKMMILGPSLGILTSLYVFCSQNKHLLVSLLSLEGVVLNLYLLIAITNTMSTNSFILVFITLAVCEAALGLSILISIVRTHNNDFVNSLNLF